MNKVLNYLFYDDVYGIAIRKVDSDEEFYYTKKPSFKYWYADPFVCHEGNQEYVFAEVFDYVKGIGRIGVAPIQNNQIGDFKIVLKEPFHLSFPHIFKYQNEWYMVPETGSSDQMRLYHATSFPYEWELDTILLDHVNWVDTVFKFINESEAIGFTYDYKEKVAKPILLDMSNKTMRVINVRGSYSLERPGGTFYQKDGKMYRVLQDCVRCYGDYMHVFEVHNIDLSSISEVEVGEIHAQDLKFDDGMIKKYTHTYNNDGIYEVVDYRTERFNLVKMPIWAWWKINR